MKEIETYLILEQLYIKKTKERLDKLGVKYHESMFFPNGWYIHKNYQYKVDTLTEAIENEILISDTKIYNDEIRKIKGIK